jgi:anti-sigma regulatory factor (Ser/Thr protein kinase)
MLKKNKTSSGLLFEMTPELQYVDTICEDVKRFLMDNGLKKLIFETGLVVREALCNGIVHGCKEGRGDEVRFEFSLKDGWVTMSVHDNGPGWDWRNHRWGLPESTQDSGRGLYIMKHYADEVTYNDRGNRLLVRKRVS